MVYSMEFNHIPVLLEQTIDGLAVKENGIYVDCTIGGGGHSSEILKRNKNIRLIGIDQDSDAVVACCKRFEGLKNVTIVQSNFKDADVVLDTLGISEVDGILADLGVSSHQIDSKDRGFSFRFDAKLDMRMNQEQSLSAYDVVNSYSQEELKRIIKDFGEDKFASSIARNIVKARNVKSIETTKQLEQVILNSVPRYKGNDGSSNVQRTFQAIRIEVNHELDILKDFIFEMVNRLKKGGRMAIITFHSLEDRIVKHSFRELATGCTCPSDFPICVCGKKPKVKLVNNHPIIASEEELKVNRRAASAKLRIIDKL